MLDVIWIHWKAWNGTQRAERWMLLCEALNGLKSAFIFNINAVRAAQLQRFWLVFAVGKQLQTPQSTVSWTRWTPRSWNNSTQVPTKSLHVTMVTLLAASTLAQTASIAALSSRRRAFFSFALLDFLWTREVREEMRKCGDDCGQKRREKQGQMGKDIKICQSDH